MKDYSNYYPPFKDVILNSGKTIFEQQLLGSEGKDVLINNTLNTKALVNYHQNPLNEFKQNRKITFWHDVEVERGDIVKTVEDNRIFMIISQVNRNDLVKYALMRECNHNLKWVNSSNNLIIKPSIVSAQTLYTTGVKDEKVIEIPNGMIGIQVLYDGDTKNLDRGQSFVFNKTKYKITFYNETEYEGLIVLICTEIGTSHLDDKINEVADRWVEINGEKIDRLPWLNEQEPPEEPTIPEEPTGITYTITVQMPYPNDPDNEIWLGDTAIYTIHKFVDSVEVAGKFTFEITDTSIATITNTTDNTVSIKANDFVGSKNIKLIATDTGTEQIAIEKEITIKGR